MQAVSGIIFFGYVHAPVAGVFRGGIAFTAARGCSHQMVRDQTKGDAPWVAEVPSQKVIILGDDLFVHPFDLIGAAPAPAGP